MYKYILYTYMLHLCPTPFTCYVNRINYELFRLIITIQVTVRIDYTWNLNYYT